jgi:regulator of chromosome condensation
VEWVAGQNPRMTSAPRRRSRARTAGIAAAAIVLLLLTGCSAVADALLGPPCRDATAAPRPAPPVPGTVYVFRPHFDDVNGLSGPQAVPGWTDVVSIAGSDYTTFAVKADGTVWVYGKGHIGSLGDGDLSTHSVAVPQRVPGLTDARSVHVVGSAVFVVRSDGTVLGWGENLLAHGGRTDGGGLRGDVATPIPVGGLDDVVTITGGDGLVAIAVRGDGAVLGWGFGAGAILGRPGGRQPYTVRDAGCVVSAASAGSAVVVATADGEARAWGNNGHGLLARETSRRSTKDSVTVSGPVGVVQVAGGRHIAYALDATGGVWAWGRGAHGALGDGDASDHVSAAPTRIAGLPPVRWIGATGQAAFAIDSDGGLWGWGWRLAHGQDTPNSARPVQIPLPGPALAVSGGHAIVGPSAT